MAHTCALTGEGGGAGERLIKDLMEREDEQETDCAKILSPEEEEERV